jgi:fido (protein-threonine AMPylation protein)
MTHKWDHIQDLPDNWRDFCLPEVSSIATIWREQAERLRQKDAIKTFNEQLAREWAIETGIIENVYQLDRGVTIVLIERGLDAALIPYGASDRPPEEIIRIVEDHRGALEGLFSFIKQDRKLSKSYICELHQQITAHQATVVAKNTLGHIVEVELKRGKFKELPNNPAIPGKGLHEYCPPEQVDSDMDQLIVWHGEHEGKQVPPDIEAAWLHHRFTQIHPFQDGNGRVARALASLVLIKGNYFPLLITRENRAEYLDALAVADASDLRPLVQLFAQIQKNCFLKALSLSNDVIEKRESVQAVIKAAIDRIIQRKEDELSERRKVFETARLLEDMAYTRCREVSALLERQLRTVQRSSRVTPHRSVKNNDFWYRAQIDATAAKHNYVADTRTYRAWISLRIVDERTTSVVISLHAVGTEFLGIMAANAFVEHRSPQGEGESGVPAVEGPYPVSARPFEFSYIEQPSAVKQRFEEWLNETLTLGLDQWRRQL